jgi:hypothetical protein
MFNAFPLQQLLTRKHLIVKFYVHCLKGVSFLARVVADIHSLTSRYLSTFTANINLYHYNYISRYLNTLWTGDEDFRF